MVPEPATLASPKMVRMSKKSHLCWHRLLRHRAALPQRPFDQGFSTSATDTGQNDPETVSVAPAALGVMAGNASLGSGSSKSHQTT
jgi:hypothetical protein